jgi:osmotically-inducible protein OsmY
MRDVRIVTEERALFAHDDSSETTDADVAARVERLLAESPHTFDDVRAEVNDGVVALTGSVAWRFQRSILKRDIEPLEGVRGVVDLTVVRPQVSADLVQRSIHRALVTVSGVAPLVRVSVAGTEVTLRGEVATDAERTAAGSAAWGCPHVSMVRNLLTVG